MRRLDVTIIRETVVVEPGECGGLLVMLDNGEVHGVATIGQAHKLIRRDARLRARGPVMLITRVQYRCGVKP